MRELRDARAKLFDLARDEGAVDERAEPRVDRRLARDHGKIVDVVERPHVLRRLGQAELLARRDMQDLAAEAAVAKDAVHRLVAGEAPHAELFPEEDGRDGADALEGGVGVLVESGIGGVERDAASDAASMRSGAPAHPCGEGLVGVLDVGLASPNDPVPCQDGASDTGS